MNATGFPPNMGQDPPGTATSAARRRRRRPDAATRAWMGTWSSGSRPPGLGLRGATRFLGWMQERGDLPDGWPEPDLDAWAAGVQALALEDVEAATASLQPAIELIASYIAKHTKAELYAEAVARDYMLAPLYTADEVAADPQLAARDFWIEVGGERFPGPFAKLSRTPIAIDRAAPALRRRIRPSSRRRAPRSRSRARAPAPRDRSPSPG